MSRMSDKYTVRHILNECPDLAYIGEIILSANDMKGLYQNFERCNVIPKSDKYIRKNLKEISRWPSFSYKLFLDKKCFKKIWSFLKLSPKYPFYH